MKKIFLALGLVVVLSTGLSSCKKDWSCICTDQSGNQNSQTINNETLIDARSKCKSMSYTNTTLGTSTSCSLQ
ncbi:MAG: hypothetical protein JWO06_1312 [Bacteroidota bacterium]|nr:hypothetical protein [Bacteroidota bacterium]